MPAAWGLPLDWGLVRIRQSREGEEGFRTDTAGLRGHRGGGDCGQSSATPFHGCRTGRQQGCLEEVVLS